MLHEKNAIFIAYSNRIYLVGKIHFNVTYHTAMQKLQIYSNLNVEYTNSGFHSLTVIFILSAVVFSMFTVGFILLAVVFIKQADILTICSDFPFTCSSLKHCLPPTK